MYATQRREGRAALARPSHAMPKEDGQPNPARFFDANSGGRLYIKLILKGGTATRYVLTISGASSPAAIKISQLIAEIEQLHRKFTGHAVSLARVWDSGGFALHKKQEVWSVLNSGSCVLATDSPNVTWTNFIGGVAEEVTAATAAAKIKPVKKEKRRRAKSDYNMFMGARLRELKAAKPELATTELFSLVSREWATNPLNKKVTRLRGTAAAPLGAAAAPASITKAAVPPKLMATAKAQVAKASTAKAAVPSPAAPSPAKAAAAPSTAKAAAAKAAAARAAAPSAAKAAAAKTVARAVAKAVAPTKTAFVTAEVAALLSLSGFSLGGFSLEGASVSGSSGSRQLCVTGGSKRKPAEPAAAGKRQVAKRGQSGRGRSNAERITTI